MQCDLTHKVSLLFDGELPPAEQRDVEGHLDLCGACQTAREDFLQLRGQIADYPLELDAIARRRALKRILAAGRNEIGLEPETTTPMPRPRVVGAGVFGLPRFGLAGLAALSLLLLGVAAGVVSLMSSRRAPVEVALRVPTPAPAENGRHDSPATTPPAPPTTPGDATPNATKPRGAQLAAGNNREHARAEASRGESMSATGDARAAVTRRRAAGTGGRAARQSSTPANLDSSRIGALVAESARNVAGEVDGARPALAALDAQAALDADDADDAKEADDRGVNAGARREAEVPEGVGSSKTARHVEQAQLLLRSFRNARPAEAGRRASADLAHEKQRSRKLLYENIVLRREAANRGNLPVESLLDSLEPILLDIANLPDEPAPADLRVINERVRRKNLVAMLQISAVESAAATARTY